MNVIKSFNSSEMFFFHSECYDGHSTLSQSERSSSLSRCSQMVWRFWAASKTLPGKKLRHVN
jgi:hypothetical protein